MPLRQAQRAHIESIMKEVKRDSASPERLPLSPVWLAVKMAGRQVDKTASMRSVMLTPTPVTLNSCSLYRVPPARKAQPSTSSMLDNTEPRSDSCTTRSSPARSPATETMTSVAFPNDAFRSPPTVGFVYIASCSVMKPRRSASGLRGARVNTLVAKHGCKPLLRRTRWTPGQRRR